MTRYESILSGIYRSNLSEDDKDIAVRGLYILKKDGVYDMHSIPGGMSRMCIDRRPPHDHLLYAFYWDKTNEGSSFWHMVHSEIFKTALHETA